MCTRHTLDSTRPSSVGASLAHAAFSLGLHGSTSAAASALCCSVDTASRILSRDRRDHRDPTIAETGALVEHLGARDTLAALAAVEGARVVYPVAGAPVDLSTAPMGVMVDASLFLARLTAAVADGKVDEHEWAELLPMIDGLHDKIDRVVAAAAAKRVSA